MLTGHRADRSRYSCAMPPKKKSNRGANLADAREVKRIKSAIDAGADELEDPTFKPSEDHHQPSPPGSPLEADVVPKPAEPGEKHAAVRAAARDAGGAHETRRLDDDAERHRRSYQREKEMDSMASIKDVLDGTLLSPQNDR